jgi:hypothetical protein
MLILLKHYTNSLHPDERKVVDVLEKDIKEEKIIRFLKW